MTAALHVLRAGDVTDFPKAGDDQAVSLRNSQWRTFDPDFAELLRQDYPGVWSRGGNILGNTQYRRLRPVAERGGKPETDTEEEAVRLREAWGARHFDNSRIAGVVAQVKWLVVGTLGEGGMKDLLREAMEREDDDRAARVGMMARSGVTLCPPLHVRELVASASRDGASLADVSLAARIEAGCLTVDDLHLMAAEEAGPLSGGASGAVWAADELSRVMRSDPWAWLVRADESGPQTGDREWWATWLREVQQRGERRMLASATSALRWWQGQIVDRVPDVLGPYGGRAAPTLRTRELPPWVLELLGTSEATTKLRATLGQDIVRVLEIAFRFAARDLGMAGQVWNPTLDPATQQIGQMITRVTQTTVDRVVAVVTEALAQGATTQEIQAVLMQDPAFGRARALTIARTETGKVATSGTKEALKQAQALGLKVEQSWLAALDADQFPRRHDLVNPAPIPVGGAWTLPSGVTTTGPGQSGVAGEDINCRCAIRPRRAP